MLKTTQVFNALFSTLKPREKEVVSGRFGLGAKGECETLAAIGERLQITRERVRQIEKSALELLAKQVAKTPACTELLASAKKQLKAAGGVMRKEDLVDYGKKIMEGLSDNHVALLLEASPTFYFHLENENYRPFYYLDKNCFKTASAFLDNWIVFLKSKKNDVLGGSYKSHFKNFVQSKKIGRHEAESYLSISKKIGSNSYGDIGLEEWPEIKPRTTRDRIYLVLKKKGAPLHFEAIAKTINEARLGTQVSLAPTVHNELIKDDRFVLVGRGIYGLKEHGYEPGIAREVIQKILKRNGSLKSAEIVAHVQRQRFFKPNTILINLQNKNFFARTPDGKYKVIES